MAFKLSYRSLSRLEGVHPHLVQVVERAILHTEVDFCVVEGVRSLATQRRYYDLGKTTTMNSRHLTGHAVDLAPWINGRIDWENPIGWEGVSGAMKLAAHELGIPLVWGGDWHTFIDKPHYQLPWKNYP